MNTDSINKPFNAICGVFEVRLNLEAALAELKNQGISPSDISILVPDQHLVEQENSSVEGVATGASTGILGGGVLGWLVGIGALTIPGIGAFVAAGPIISAIAGAGIGGTVGGLTGGLIGMGIPESDAVDYENHLQKGGMLLSVHVNSLEQSLRVREILNEFGVQKIMRTSEDQELEELLSLTVRHKGHQPDSYTNEL